MPRMAISLRIVRKCLAFARMRYAELRCFLDLLRQTFDARFAFKVRSDCKIQSMKAPKSIFDLNMYLGVVDAFA